MSSTFEAESAFGDGYAVSITEPPRYSSASVAAPSGGAGLLHNPIARAIILGVGAVPTVLVGIGPADAQVVPVDPRTETSAATIVGVANFAPERQPVLRQGDRGDAVIRLQARLTQLGYPAGATQGVFDANVRASVVAYQNHRGLDDDGIVGRATWTALAAMNVRNASSSPPPTSRVSANPRVDLSNPRVVSAADWSPASQPVVQLGSSGPAVRALQARLSRLGYDVGTPDGAFGRKTRAAVVEYQLDQNLPLSSRVTAGTWQRLAEAQPVRAAGPTHTPGGTPIRDTYTPRSAEARALFREAAIAAGLPASWGHSEALHNLLTRESQGRVGVPNFTYGSVRNDSTRYREVHAELLLGIKSARSSATGLGQLLLDNVEAHYPSGRRGIGDPLEEAIGMLKYIEARYGTPEAAWRQYNRHHQGY